MGRHGQAWAGMGRHGLLHAAENIRWNAKVKTEMQFFFKPMKNNPNGEPKALPASAQTDRDGDAQSGGFHSRRWGRLARLTCLILSGGVMGFAFWKEAPGIFRDEAGGWSIPDVPALGEGEYAGRMVRTLGEVVEDHNLRGASLAVWGGDLAGTHDLPFRYRVTADWFLLPGKPIPVVATAEEAMRYDSILSPWSGR